MADLSVQNTVGEWVANKPRRAETLERLGLDYCCGGRRSLEAACLDQDLDPAAVARLLLAVAEPLAAERDWGLESLSALSTHIEQTHHVYLREQLPRLDALASKVAGAHGERHPEYVLLARDYPDFRAELEAHMVKEEQVLFPAIRALEAGETSAAGFHCGDLSEPIRVMEAEHEAAGESLRHFRALTHAYRAPADACGSLLALLDGLASLERDLHLHIHKENNLLFPRTRALLSPEQAVQSPRN
jgi:regulator of cell morphogenesis and NO signaling